MTELKPTTTCERCGYDLRGISSKLCPECGAPLDFIIVRIVEPQQFHFARAALEKENLISRFINPGGAMGIIAELTSDRSGWLWIRADEADRAEEILDELGIITSLGAKPIVDRAEPLCPKCDRALDANGPEVCEHCGTLFQWVDIESEPFDPTGQVCVACGYELTGNVSGNCPECGNPVIGELYEVSPETIQPRMSKEARKALRNACWQSFSVLFGVMLLILFPAVQTHLFIDVLYLVFAFALTLYGTVGVAISIARNATYQ